MRMLPVRSGANAWTSTRVDDDVYTWASAHSWRVFGKGYVGRKIYSHSENGKSKYKTQYLHRLIAQPAEYEVVDHADGDTFNNCQDNLRPCSSSENNRNRKASSGTTSQYKGVRLAHPSARMKSRPWTASISIDGKYKHLGYFVAEEEAAAAYNQAALEASGEFAVLNIFETLELEPR